MGKSLIITEADFSANGFHLEGITPSWISNSFIYAEDDKCYPDIDNELQAFYLKSGQTISYYLNIGENTAKNIYAKIQVGVINGHVSIPSGRDVSLGTITRIITIEGDKRFPAVPVSSYTAEADVTFFITGNVGDTFFVIDT